MSKPVFDLSVIQIYSWGAISIFSGLPPLDSGSREKFPSEIKLGSIGSMASISSRVEDEGSVGLEPSSTQFPLAITSQSPSPCQFLVGASLWTSYKSTAPI